MDNKLFRQKSIDRVSSPEQLNEYIKVSNPGIWIVLSAILVLVVGLLVWGIFGRVTTSVSGACISSDGKVSIYMKYEDMQSVEKGMKVSINHRDYEIIYISKYPIKIDDSFVDVDYICYLGGFSKGQWVYELKIDDTPLSGAYTAEIVVENVAPISFLFN